MINILIIILIIDVLFYLKSSIYMLTYNQVIYLTLYC